MAQRSVAASPTIESFRPIGNSRAWVFYSRQTTFGHVTSVVTGRKEVEGQEALVLKESLQMDFTKLGQANRTVVSGESYITQHGFFAGCDYQVGPPDSAEQLSLTPGQTRLSGFYTNNGAKSSVDLPWKAATFFWDAYMVDQLEAYLAMHDLQIGTILDDSLLSPQSLVFAHIEGKVTWFMWQEIFKGKTDSVFVINLTEPGTCQLFFTPDKKLVKIDFKDMGIRVYQDDVRQVKQPDVAATDRSTPAQTPTVATFSFRALVFKLPHYVAFLVIATVTLLILATRAFKWSVAYLALVAGLVIYVLVPFVVNPAFGALARSWLKIGSSAATGFYFRGAVLSFVSGLVQVGLIFAAVKASLYFTRVPAYRVLGLAAFVGAGYAIAEAVYLSRWQIAILFEWSLLERASYIVMSIAAGALIGRFLKEDLVLAIGAALGAAVALGVARFFPMLVQGRLFDLELTHFILAIWAALFLVVVLMLSRKTFERPGEDETVETA